MSTTQAIYIQGCARSGNTLMRELCVSGYEGAELVKLNKHTAECSLAHVAELVRNPPAKPVMAKIFGKSTNGAHLWVASRNYENSVAMDKDLLRANTDVKVLWMLRDPRDVLTSMHADQPGKYYVKPDDWLKGLRLYQQFANEPQVFTVRYEELVGNPDAMQAKISAFGHLKESRKFVEGYKYFPQFFENVRAMHSIRPIDTNSVEKWRSHEGHQKHLRDMFKTHPEIVTLAKECGYEVAF